MLQVALNQVKSHSRRFVAIALAVLLAVAFLAATLMVNASTQASLKNSIGAAYAKADLVVSPAAAAAPTGTDAEPATPLTSRPLTGKDAAAVAAVPSVAASYGQQSVYVQAHAGDATVASVLRNLPADSSLEPVDLVSGSWPTGPRQAGVDAHTAARLHLSVGSTVEFSTLDQGGADGAAGNGAAVGADGAAARPRYATVRITGILAPSTDPMMSAMAQFVGVPDQVSQLAGSGASLDAITVRLAPGTDLTAARSALGRAVGQPADAVLTGDEKTQELVQSFTGGSSALTMVLLAFAAIALLVSALVVSNTFSVLIAQRTRELALLRCIGAARGQIRRSVIVEALIVGFIASVLGVAAATATMGGLIAVLSRNPDYRFATLAVPPSAIVTGLVVGTLLTVLAALVPARAATAVAPLAALRPQDDVTLANTRGRVRVGIGVLLILLGGAGLVLGGLTSQLPLALPAGAASFVGVLLAGTVFVPRLVSWAGRLALPAGVPGTMARANALRNPRRTTATASALLIGVTLVTMMMTGAATAREAFNGSLAGHYPVDATAMATGGPNGPAFTAGQVDRVKALGGVTAVASLESVGTVDVSGYEENAYGISEADAAAVLADRHNRPAPGSVVLPKGTPAASAGLRTSDGTTVSLPVQAATTGDFPPLVALGTVPSKGAPAGSGPRLLWISLDKSLDPQQLTDMRTAIAQALGVEESQVGGGAMERATFNQVINTLLLVVTGLLAVAVLIALIGVANTLSLSVVERTRENSLLRALGLTRGQLRGMLALEALLIAGVAAVLGSVLGIVYGWLGAQSALGSFTTVTPAVPWGQILLVIAVAALAGLLASVVPARRAARLSPVAGLAME